MDLWIRSQDRKRLTKAEDIYMVEDKDNFTSYIGNNIVGHLGEYKKVGRALEILDEIQLYLKPKIDLYGVGGKIDTIEMKNVSVNIYQMPEE